MKEPDINILKSAILFDRKAQLALYRWCFPSLQFIAKRYFLDDGDRMNLVNSSFIKIIDNLEKYKEGNFKAWISRIASNEAIDQLRKNKKYNHIFHIGIPFEKQDNSDYSEVEKEIEDQYLIHLVNSLNPSAKIVFNMFAVDGFSHKEISERLGITVETSKWHTKMARKKLKELIFIELKSKVS